ncbi:MAG: DUF3291 domain-containing protein, partial [Bryobacteraceae bacterium]
DPHILFNLTVWESPEALKAFLYHGRHSDVMRDRGEWFVPHDGPSVALWWIPAGQTPSVEEAVARLEHLRRKGETPEAFSFRRIFPPPEARPPLDYDNRRFTLRENSATGEVDMATIFHYRQRGSLVWAHYSGGAIRSGSLTASVNAEGILDAVYSHVNRFGETRSGVCRTVPEVLDDGRLRLHERWRWTTGDGAEGRSTVEEVR